MDSYRRLIDWLPFIREVVTSARSTPRVLGSVQMHDATSTPVRRVDGRERVSCSKMLPSEGRQVARLLRTMWGPNGGSDRECGVYITTARSNGVAEYSDGVLVVKTGILQFSEHFRPFIVSSQLFTIAPHEPTYTA